MAASNRAIASRAGACYITRCPLPIPSHLAGTATHSTAVSSKCWAGLQALPVPSKSSGDADSPRWTDRGLQDNRSKRAKEESAHGCGFIGVSSFSEAPEDNERIMIDSMPVMAWRCRVDGFVEFFNGRWLEYIDLS